MTDDEIRQLVRDAIAKHLGPRAAVPTPMPGPGLPPAPAVPISFARYAVPRAAGDVMCVIEPSVRCNHCGYCQCHGHQGGCERVLMEAGWCERVRGRGRR